MESSSRYWQELVRNAPPEWVSPSEMSVPTAVPSLNLVIQMLSSELFGNDVVELVGLFLAEKSRFNQWYQFGVQGKLGAEQYMLLGPQSSQVVGRVYEKWEAFSRKMERRGRVAHSADRELGQLVAALRAGIAELARLRRDADVDELAFDGFSDSARRVVGLALDEARASGRADPEHILLGIGLEGHGVAAEVLDAMGASLVDLRRDVAALADGDPAREVDFSERAETVFGLARAEGVRLIGTEHLLLGVIRENGAASGLLAEQGVTLERVRVQIRECMDGRMQAGEPLREMTPAEIALESRIAEVGAAKVAALKTGDYESATRFRQQEKDLMREFAEIRATT